LRNALRFVSIAVGVALALTATTASAEGTFFKKRNQAEPTAPPPQAVQQPAPQAPPQQPEPAEPKPDEAGTQNPAPRPTDEEAPAHASQSISGHIDHVVTTSTFVVAGQQLELLGVAGEPAPYVDALTGWLAQNGNQLRCDPAGAKYRCFTSKGADVGGVVIYNGAGKADADAPPEYQNAQAQARAQRKGVWRQ
jgi:endonuclease YncB( thermonuclease family)